MLAFVAPGAVAEVYGGLGPLGTTIKSGSAGGHGEVNPGGQAHGHAFAVDTKTGDLFVADEVTVVESGKKHIYGRLQEFGPTGEFLAENRIKFKTRKEEEEEVIVERVGGLAVDPERGGHVYLLLAEQRRENKQEIEEKLNQLEKESTKTEKEIEEVEKKITKAKEKSEPTAALEAELKQLKEKLAEERTEEVKLGKEEEALDSDLSSASDLYSFSTEASAGELKEKKTVAESALLKSASEEQRASLLLPSGIAVDPKTGDVLVLGQQNEAATAAQGEDLRAAVQRVHVDGTLGPRYIDKANCLDEGAPAAVAKEPACKEDEEEWPVSPIVTPNGRLYAQVGSEELWEIPSSAEAEAGFEEIEVTPRFLTELDGEITEPGGKKIVKGTLAEEEGGTLSYVPGKTASEGTIYMRAQVPNAGENGVVRWHYTEGGAKPEATEEGWTGGQEKASTQVKCVVRGESNTQPLVAGGTGEQVLMLSYLAGDVLAFGPSAGAEGCGHEPTVTPPSIEVGNKPHATEAGIGQPVKLSSQLSGARATSTTWKLEDKDPATGATHEEEVTTPYAIQDVTALTRPFEHEGTYEITEVVHTDSLAFPTITAETVKLLVVGIKAPLALPEAIAAHEEVAIRARVEDRVETPLHLKAVWSFGDNTPPVEAHYEGANPLVIEVKHTFAAPGHYELTLEVRDESGGHTTVTTPVVVAEDQAEREARERVEREAHEREVHEREERERAEREARERVEREAHEREAHERAEEKRANGPQRKRRNTKKKRKRRPSRPKPSCWRKL